MTSDRKDAKEFRIGLEIPPETPYLIEDLEDLVNRKAETFLKGSPFRVKATDFRPELISGNEAIGIDRLAFRYLPPAPKLFSGIDLLVTFPIYINEPTEKDAENPLNLTLKWSNETQVRLAVVDRRRLLLAEESGDNGRTFHAEQLHPEVFDGYIESLGLPKSFWGNDIKEITRDLYNCPDFSISQSAKTGVDIGTTLEIIHDARLKQDDDDEKQLVQELCINIDHARADIPVIPGELYLPPQPKYRNMLRFKRADSNDKWKFAGAYHGKLDAGELYDELEQINPRLGIPSGKVLDKALATLDSYK